MPPRAPKSWLVDEAYAALKSAILANDFAPGHQVSAQVLAERFGMSRTPVQEAALRLQQEGLVEILPKRGIRIRALSVADLAEIYAVIIALEASAAEAIAGFADDRRIAVAERLASATEIMATAIASDDLQGWAAADAEFHRELVEATENRRFVDIIETVTAQAHRVRRLTARLRGNLDASLADHAAIIAAIRDGSTDLAFKAARTHRMRARDEMLPLIDRIGLRHF